MENSIYLDHVIVRRRRKRFHELAQYIESLARYIERIFIIIARAIWKRVFKSEG